MAPTISELTTILFDRVEQLALGDLGRPSSTVSAGSSVTDAVGEGGEAGPPGDVEDRGLGQVLVHALHDLDLERRVHRRERVVEDQDPRLRDQGARQRDALALAARHGEAAVADHAVEPAELAR